jgi:ABC-2 type transport system ATP-binding protein
MTAIELDGVEKRFGSVTALRGVDLSVAEGEIFGFLGPNGAGKSTAIDILLDFVRPTAGRATVLGYDSQAESEAVRQRTGVLPEGFDLYDRLTARQHLAFVAESKGVDADTDALLARVGLAAAADRAAGGFSKGMGQRLVLAMALVGDPDLLVLDEPTSGLDPNGARKMRELIRAERDRGATVFFSSHILSQVEAVCDRVAILVDGEIRTVDTVDDFRASVGTDPHLSVTVDAAPEDALAAARSVAGVSQVAADGDTVTIDCQPTAKLPALNALADHGATVRDFETEEASLEDLFVSFTEGGATEGPDGSAAAGEEAAGTPAGTGPAAGSPSTTDGGSDAAADGETDPSSEVGGR